MNANPGQLIADKIKKIVTDHWTTAGRPLPMSRLGVLLSQEGLSTRALFPQGGFLNYVENMSDELGLSTYRHSKKPELIGIFPEGAFPSPSDAMFEYPSFTHKKSFRPYVWQAFTERAPLNTKRVIFIDDVEGRYDDLPRVSAVPDGAWEIDSKFLNTTGFIPPVQVQQNIEDWAAQKAVDMNRLVLPSTAPPGAAGEQTLLQRLLDALSEEQRKNLQLRADIVHSLLK